MPIKRGAIYVPYTYGGVNERLGLTAPSSNVPSSGSSSTNNNNVFNIPPTSTIPNGSGLTVGGGTSVGTFESPVVCPNDNPTKDNGLRVLTPQDIGGIAGKYELEQCVNAKKAIVAELDKKKQKYEIVELQYINTGFVVSLTREAIYGINNKNTIISKKGYHVGDIV